MIYILKAKGQGKTRRVNAHSARTPEKEMLIFSTAFSAPSASPVSQRPARLTFSWSLQTAFNVLVPISHHHKRCLPFNIIYEKIGFKEGA
jgi:hypothetical protein